LTSTKDPRTLNPFPSFDREERKQKTVQSEAKLVEMRRGMGRVVVSTVETSVLPPTPIITLVTVK
jgi:hypothetical protein